MASPTNTIIWRLGFQQMDLGEVKHLAYNIYIYILLLCKMERKQACVFVYACTGINKLKNLFTGSENIDLNKETLLHINLNKETFEDT